MPIRNFSPFPVLKTERLILRQLVSTDANEIFALRSNDSVNKYLDRKPSGSIDEAKAFIRMINENIQRNDCIYWAITMHSSEQLIGTICLFQFSDDDLKAEIGYELLPDYHGKGIMQEAISEVADFGMQHIGLHAIEAYTHCENAASTRVLEKAGFKKTGTVEGDLVVFEWTASAQATINF